MNYEPLPIFDHYIHSYSIYFRPRHTHHSLKDRQAYLKHRYAFDCACIACEQDYPILQRFKRTMSVPYLKYDGKHKQLIVRGQLNEENIKTQLKKAANVLNLYSSNKLSSKFSHQKLEAEQIQRKLFDLLCNHFSFYKTLKK